MPSNKLVSVQCFNLYSIYLVTHSTNYCWYLHQINGPLPYGWPWLTMADHESQDTYTTDLQCELRHVTGHMGWVSYRQRKEGNVLFNDTLNTFYLWLFGMGHMVKDHWDGDRGNLLPPLHGLLFLISSKESFICTVPQTSCYTSRGALARTRNNSMGPPWRIDPTNHCTMTKCSTTKLHLAPIDSALDSKTVIII